MLIRHYCVIFSLVYVLSLHVAAEDIAIPDQEMLELLTLDVEQLTTVSVASKRHEKLKEAPGIITVITSEEIKLYGYRNLRDILNRQTHMQVIGSNLFPHNRVSVRGVTFSHTDNVVLPLLNGRPVREATSTSTNHDFYASFPVESIEQIEIIRGPGSVLYGTNAFAGAINIVTKKAPATPGGSTALTYGSFDTKKGSIQGGGKWGELEFYGTFNAYDIEDDDFNNITDELGNTSTYKTGSSGGNLVFNSRYKGFTLNAMISDTSRDHARSNFVLPSTEMDVERQFIDVGYKHNITENWDVSANASYHHFRDKFILGNNIGDQLGDAVDYLAEITTQARLTEKLSFLAGGTYNLQDGTIKTGDLDYNSIHLSAYMQADYWMFDWLKLIGGFQYNKPDEISGDFSPRLAAIANINKNWGVKLLYGQAFRQASPVERFIVAPGVVGDPSLKPETIETFDAQIFYNGNRGSLAATYFRSEQQDLISRTGALPQQIVNSGEVIYHGFELEGNLNMGHGFSFIGNISYQTNERNDGMDDVTYSPDWMVKTGLSYDSGHGYSLGIFNSYFAASTLQNIDINPGTAIVNPSAESFNLLSTNLMLNLGKFLNNPSLSTITLSLYGDNLLDEDIYFPSINRRDVNTLPHHEGRGLYGTIRVDF